jgi:hypothetical protein
MDAVFQSYMNNQFTWLLNSSDSHHVLHADESTSYPFIIDQQLLLIYEQGLSFYVNLDFIEIIECLAV